MKEKRPSTGKTTDKVSLKMLAEKDKSLEQLKRALEIEQALERVRARTMAMHNSEELGEVSILLYEQLKTLGVGDFINCGYVEVDQKRKIQYAWMTRADGSSPGIHQLPLVGDDILNKRNRAWKRQQEIFYQVVVGDELKKHLEFASTYFGNKEINKMIESFPDTIIFYCGNFPYGYLHIVTGAPLSVEAESILARFTKVFEQTYTRFLDLQKAEAQAKESQIQLALERVRARTMAMHKSDELVEVASVLYEQLTDLDIPHLMTGYALVDEAKETQEMWMTDLQGNRIDKFYLPLHGDAILDVRYKSWKEKTPIFFQVVKGKQLKKHLQFVSKHFASKEAEEIAENQMPTQLVFYCGNFPKGYLHIHTEQPLSTDQEVVLERLTEAFAMTFTRFLDLKKAEAQAREAQIEVALERVRSRTMAMYSSDELSETAQLLFNEAQLLGIKSLNCGFNIFENNEPTSNAWVSLAGETRPAFKIPHKGDPSLNRIYQAWKTGVLFYHEEIGGIELQEHNEYMSSLVSQKENRRLLNSQGIELSPLPAFEVFNCAFFKQGYLIIITSELNSDNEDLFKRFAKVFEQTYTRFLDLQKAEAQAREAQIEAALERVRARTMAMHNSDELINVATTMNLEFQKLGFTQSLQSSFVLIDEEKELQYLWGARTDTKLVEFIALPLFGDHVLKARFEAWKRKDLVFNTVLASKNLREHLKVVIPPQQRTAREMEGMNSLPDPCYFCCGNFKYGYLLLISTDVLAELQQNIVARMAKVFEQTYTRFLDLQKAEAQAREAQIEAALERIRARALAMHHSEELEEVAHVLREQMRLLDQPELDGCVVELYDVDSDRIESWYAFPPSASPNEEMITGRSYFDKDSCAVTQEMIEKYNSPERSYTIKVSGEKLTEWNEIVLKAVSAPIGPSKSISRNDVLTMYYHCSDFSGGTLLTASRQEPLEAVKKLQERVAVVFDLAYKRFRDLQKAEAQAREAQIEAALERVRSASMAMHQSEELPNVALTMLDEIELLGVPLFGAGVSIVNDDNNTHRLYFADNSAKTDKKTLLITGDIPLNVFWLTREHMKLHDQGHTENSFELKGKKLAAWIEWVRKYMSKERADRLQAADLKKVYVYNIAFYGRSVITISSLMQFSEEHWSILRRMSKTFAMSYSRFLDLQKVEEQAREAQIEVALERIRAASMAMHKSEELPNVALTMLNEIESLAVPLFGAGVSITNEEKNTYKLYFADNSEAGDMKTLLITQELSMDAWWLTREVNVLLDQGEGEMTFEMKGRKLTAWMEWVGKYLSKEREARLRQANLTNVFAYFIRFYGRSVITISSLQQLSEEHWSILRRMSRTFAMSFSRFLDLQKAETQAREAQIEAALERVRARSMAMHKSEELLDTAQILFQQLKELGVDLHVCGFNILDRDSLVGKEYLSIDGNLFPEPLQIQLDVDPYLMGPYEDWKAGKTKLILDIQGNALKEHLTVQLNQFKSLGSVDILANQASKYSKSGEQLQPRLVVHHAFFKYGYLFLTYDQPIEDMEILVRFANVFEQTYTRFLDLQKVEAQARETEIQLALERIRARTMAMHKSDELTETASLIFKQLELLGIKPSTFGFNIWIDNEPVADSWSCSAQSDIMWKMQVPHTHDPTLIEIYKNRTKGIPLFKTRIEGDALQKHIEYFLNLLGTRRVTNEIKSGNVQLPKVFNVHAAYFKFGYLLTVTDAPVAEAEALFPRFANVFEQTYTRFLDLQKAEAQAREAEIQLALERIRARTMAMHKSDELTETASLIFKQLELLGIKPWTFGFNIWIDDEPIVDAWSSSASSDIMWKMQVPHTHDPTLIEIYQHSTEDIPLFKTRIEGEALQRHIEYMLNLIGTDVAKEITSGNVQIPTAFNVHAAYFKFGYLLTVTDTLVAEAETLFPRFAKVFEQTYTRFLDLQKAEAQAREAQIEAALEKVRSKSLAMHKSDELREVVAVLYDQMNALDFAALGCELILCDEKKELLEYWTASPEQAQLPENYPIPRNIHPFFQQVWQAWKKKTPRLVITLKGADKRAFDKLIFEKTAFKNLPKAVKDSIRAGKIDVFSQVPMKYGLLEAVDTTPLSEEKFLVLERFAKVFEQTYTRFLDLQKAEAQAREAQIEAALERVRSRTMAMQKSEELADVATVLFQQVKALGVPQWTCGFNIWEIGDIDFTFYPGSPDGDILPPCKVPLTEDTVFKLFDESRRRGDELCIYESKGDIQKEHYRYMANLPGGLGDLLQNMLKAGMEFPVFQIDHLANFSHGNLLFITYEHFPEMHDIFKRFAKVFEQTYTRFLDLQKAEKQAREAQIETALERVRSRTMGMQRSDELQEAAVLLFQQVVALGVPAFGTGFNIWDDDRKFATAWMGGRDRMQPPFKTSSSEDIFLRIYEAAEKGETLFVEEQGGEALKTHYEYMNSIPVFKEIADKMAAAGQTFPTFQIMHCAFFSQGYLMFITFEPVPDSHDIFKRFAKVFEQTYTRFLDLQKAEAQARESQIEAALERVRARSMAMHKSDELLEAGSLLYHELLKFNISSLTSGYVLMDADEKIGWNYLSNQIDGAVLPQPMGIPHQETDVMRSITQSWKRQDPFHIIQLNEEDTIIHQTFVAERTTNFNMTAEELIAITPKRLALQTFNFKHGYLLIVGAEPLSDLQIDMLTRFAKVFEMTYQRFLDLQRAEAQAREAQIEAALERVRSKTMAMHNSQDVGDTVAAMFDELTKLGIEKTIRCGIIIIDKAKQMEVWNASSDPDGETVLVIGRLDMNLHPALLGVYHAWETKQPSFSYEFIGQDLKDYFLAITNYPDYPLKVDMSKLPAKYYNNEFYFAEGAIFAFTLEPIPAEMSKTLKRFAGVFGQTYRRYLDLQKAEAQARESIKQASLDRIRGEIASMRTTSDLERITPLIWKELTIQGIPFIRCGVFIMEEDKKIIHNYLSLPDGEAIAAFQLPYATPGAVSDILKNWQERKIFLDHWDNAAIKEFANTLVKQGIFESPDQYLAALPTDGFYLHFLPFNEGMLYVGNTTQLKEYEVQLIQSLADAFSTAYARYEDFNRLEAAKQQVDNALVNLKQAQQQLVQAEKMASLGELTAGIAHEIQNPLNFVNNFSEVSEELLTELKEELEKGDIGEAKIISDDVIQNLQKIHHHGQRASGIVKGMLEHSRTSDGKKELTDINALADEYLRLAYHGLRAKDKSFNADFKTDLDEKLPKVKVISQDMGRVILNMINNAFYAVSSKAKSSGNEDYKPEVIVSTKLNDKKVEIVIQDNGDGIPQKNIDKIFQPFFTTKPTGQGTGLGLSLSYDIVTKGHNGHLEVESDEGIGTRFIIRLPFVRITDKND